MPAKHQMLEVERLVSNSYCQDRIPREASGGVGGKHSGLWGADESPGKSQKRGWRLRSVLRQSKWNQEPEARPGRLGVQSHKTTPAWAAWT